MNYKSFNLGDWIGHISGVIEDETTLDGNEMRDLVEFLTTINQQPCEDCISRKAVLALPTSKTKTLSGEIIEEEVDIKLIKALPPVTPKEKTGYWIDHSDEGYVECPFCDHATTCDDNIDELHYCFYCGARMVSE
jgi:hypothetical protein